LLLHQFFLVKRAPFRDFRVRGTGPGDGGVEEVMSHLQALPGVQIEMTLEVQVNAPGGIDEQTARIVLENSAALKVEKPGLY
jgi:hypothetical protein